MGWLMRKMSKHVMQLLLLMDGLYRLILMDLMGWYMGVVLKPMQGF